MVSHTDNASSYSS